MILQGFIFAGVQSKTIGPLHHLATWYKITHAGDQVAQWDFQNNATRTSLPGPAFVLEVPLCNLVTSMCDFVPCDRVMQRAYSVLCPPHLGKKFASAIENGGLPRCKKL